jgi:hypothetical protein
MIDSDKETLRDLNMQSLDERSPNRKRGRPRKEAIQKKVRQTITLDPGAWDRLCQLAKTHGYDSGSTFINDLGVKVAVSPERSELDRSEVPAIDRLLSCGDPPSSRLWSVFSFIRTISLRLGLIDHPYANESLIEDTARQAMTVLCLRSFLEPDNHVNNITGYTNWISWHILQARAGIEETQINPLQLNSLLPQSDSIEPFIWQHVNAIELLRANSFGDYQIFQMAMMERFSGRQIDLILKLREHDINPADSLNRVKNVMHTLRLAWHDEASKKETPKKIKDKWKKDAEYILKVSQRYLELIRRKDLINNKEAREQIELILLSSIRTPLLDVFIREIDHAYGCQISGDLEKYNYHQKDLRQNLYFSEKKLTEYFSENVSKLKKKLAFAGSTRRDIYDTFMKFIREDNNCCLSKEYLFNLRSYVFGPRSYVLTPDNESIYEGLVDVRAHFAHLFESQHLPWKEIPSEMLNNSTTKLVGGCIENEGKLMCGYSK